MLLAEAGLKCIDVEGIAWSPTRGLHLSDDVSLNYSSPPSMRPPRACPNPGLRQPERSAPLCGNGCWRAEASARSDPCGRRGPRGRRLALGQSQSDALVGELEMPVSLVVDEYLRGSDRRRQDMMFGRAQRLELLLYLRAVQSRAPRNPPCRNAPAGRSLPSARRAAGRKHGPRLHHRVPVLGLLVPAPVERAEIVDHAQVRGGGEVGEAQPRPGEPAAVVEQIIEIVEMLRRRCASPRAAPACRGFRG